MGDLVSKRSNKTVGTIYAAMSFGLWGVLPLYWKVLKNVSAGEILANRILWSFVFVSVLIIFFKQRDKLIVVLRNKKNLKLIVLCSVMITINWFTYIWAVNNDHIVDTSLGYYINPLLAVGLGVTILKENINKIQIFSLCLATIGVILITVQYGRIPWISIILALSFALYGLFKKMLAVDSIIGLALETLIIMPFALSFILFKQISGSGALGAGSIITTLLLVGAGIVTATPLLWFAKAANRVELSTIGFLQYISPTIGLFIGTFIYKEAFTKIHLISFGFIWAALILYSLSHYNIKKNIETAEIEV